MRIIERLRKVPREFAAARQELALSTPLRSRGRTSRYIESRSKKRDEYTSNDYHKVTDEVKPDWDLSGAVEDLRLLFETGYKVAQADKWPEWKPGTEFKAKREAMLKTSGS